MSDIFAPGSLSNAILYGDPHLFELDEADSKQDLTPQFQTDRFHAWVQIGDRVIDVNTGNSGKAFTQGHPIKVARVPKAPIYKEDPGLQARVLLSHPPSGGITDAKLDRMVDLYKQLQKNPGAMMIEVEEGKIKVNADGSFTQIA